MSPQERPEFAEWEPFIANAIGGLRCAAAELHRRRAEFERLVGWFRPGGSGIPYEVSVGQALKQIFDEIRARQAISGSGVQSPDLRHISIDLEKRRSKDPAIGPKAKPTDYSFVLLQDHELDLRVEAKTIENEGEVRREYLGARGMLRFEDPFNPYTVEPFGGMVAYVDSDAVDWTRSIAIAVADAIGGDRCHTVAIGRDEHSMSRHRIKVAEGEDRRELDVDVVHFVLEIDASPSRR